MGGAHRSHGRCHPTLGHFPRALGTAPGPWLAHPKAGEARRGFCRETLLHPAEGLGTFPHILPTCTEGHQPLGPAREPVHPVDLQRLSRPGGRGPGVIRATRKGRGADRLRNSEEDGTRSRASLQAASRASGESPGGPQDPHCPPPRFLRGLCPSAWLRESPQASPPLAALPSTYPHDAQIRRCPQNPRCREGLQGPPTGFSSPRTPHRSPDTLPSRPQEMAFFQDRDHLESQCLSSLQLCSRPGPAPPGAGPHSRVHAGARAPRNPPLRGWQDSSRQTPDSAAFKPQCGSVGPAPSWFYRGVSGPVLPTGIFFPEWK